MPDNVKDNPVEKREALLADRLRLHKGYRQRFVKGKEQTWTDTRFPSVVAVAVTGWRRASRRRVGGYRSCAHG